MEEVLIAIEFDIKERLELQEQHSESEYIKGMIDCYNICLGIVNSYKK